MTTQTKNPTRNSTHTQPPANQPKSGTLVLVENQQEVEAALVSVDLIDRCVSDYRKRLEEPLMQDFKKAIITAQTIRQIRAAMTGQVVDLLKSLMNSPLGFLTDRGPHAYRDDYKTPYDDETIRTCALEATLKGVLWTGNQFNILAGRCYITKEGYYYLLSRLSGLTDLNVVPSVPVVREGNTVVRVAANWKKDGVASSLKDHEGKPGRNFPITINKGMGPDAVIGKAYRKAYKCIWDQIHGCESSEDEDATDALPGRSATNSLKDRIRDNGSLPEQNPEPPAPAQADDAEVVDPETGEVHPSGGALFDGGSPGRDSDPTR